MTAEKLMTLRDKPGVRWAALALLAFTMFAGYLFADLISSLKDAVERAYGWTSDEYSILVSAYSWFNVFLLMLVIVGILLDKLGIRFSAIASATIMVLGAAIKYWAVVSPNIPDTEVFGLKLRVLIAALGYATFGTGVEYAGITATKAIVKWFKGKELALAMGMQVAVARLGTALALAISPWLSEHYSVPTVFLIGVLALLIGWFSYLIYTFVDRKLDKQLEALKVETGEEEVKEEFRLADLKVILSNRGFWYIAMLCVLFYSAVFSFFRFGADLMVNKYGLDPDISGTIPALVPFGTILLTPLFGGIYDRFGKGATIMIIGSVMVFIVHLILWLPIKNIWIVAADMILLGIAFSLVPAAMWPSVPKILPERVLGTAYAVIFWIQNLGAFFLVPRLVGKVLEITNPERVNAVKTIHEQLAAQGLTPEQIADKIEELTYTGQIPRYDYTEAWLIFVVLSALAIVFAILLKIEDKRKGYGIEEKKN